MEDCTKDNTNANSWFDLSYSTDEELLAPLVGDEAQVSETESSGDEGLPALEYDRSSSPPMHSPIVSNGRADLLAVPMVTQYPDDVLITRWGLPDDVSTTMVVFTARDRSLQYSTNVYHR